MTRIPQSHIVVEVDGELRPLFSVLEQKNKGLIVTTHCASEFWAGLDPKHSAAGKNAKHTVHHSPNSKDGGLLIHHTQLMEEKDDDNQYKKIDVRCYTLAVRDKKFQPIYVRAVRRLSKSTFLSDRPNDTAYSVGRVDQKRGTLLYGIVLSAIDQSPGFHTAEPYEVFSLPFGRYRIHVFTAVSRVPSGCFDIYGHIVSCAPDVPFGPPVGSYVREPRPGYPVQEMKVWTPWSLFRIMIAHAERSILAGLPRSFVESRAGMGPISISDFNDPIRRETHVFNPNSG